MVLVIVCTMVYDHLSAAGYEHGTTPFLDDVASRGAFFENAVSASSWTQPAATSILTGLSPNVHRMVVYHPTGAVARRQVEPERVLSSHVTTLAECLADAGYDTFSRINNVQAGDFFNIPQGFDDQLTDWRMRTPGMISDLDRWLEERQSDRPFLALLLTRDAHLVYRPSYEHYRRVSESPVAREAYRGHPRRVYEAVKGSIAAGELPERELRRQFVSLYDGALAQLDADLAELDRLLERRGLTDTTVLAITGDHGERFFERGRIGHAHWLDEATVHVPLILSGPGVPKGQRYDTVVSTMDLFPTLATMAGATSPAAVQGVDLGPLLRGRPEAPRSVFASFTRDKTVLHMVRLGPYKLHMDADGGLELYNVAADPLEQENLIRVEPRTAKRLEVELDRWLDREREMRAAIPESTEERVLTPEMIEQLRALGYLE
jgi:arylsulfatase A-like enzyme